MWEKQEKHKWTNKEWLDSSGAEIVLEVVRRIGWTVEVYDAEKWNFLDNIVSAGDRDAYRIEINGAMPPWQQAVAAVATADSHFRRFDSYEACKFPFFMMAKCRVSLRSAKLTNSLIGSNSAARLP